MKGIIFSVGLAPVGKGRPRATAVGGRARVYTPQKTREWERQFRILARPHCPPDPFTGPVLVDVFAAMPRPKRLRRKKDPDGLLWAPVRPDLDNIRKAVLDALDDFWLDDAQVVGGCSYKAYCERTSHPRVVVRIQEAPVSDDGGADFSNELLLILNADSV